MTCFKVDFTDEELKHSQVKQLAQRCVTSWCQDVDKAAACPVNCWDVCSLSTSVWFWAVCLAGLLSAMSLFLPIFRSQFSVSLGSLRNSVHFSVWIRHGQFLLLMNTPLNDCCCRFHQEMTVSVRGLQFVANGWALWTWGVKTGGTKWAPLL